ncbi:Glutamate permease [Chromobacterium violaceum]|uniref:Sodium/glutamate symporter n=1 Tax=Chromobacterium violaceum TaxID=536 RepID=A0A447T8D8_CHRVL|nr:Glutamate permease [Chromobacterium violaceum]
MRDFRPGIGRADRRPGGALPGQAGEGAGAEHNADQPPQGFEQPDAQRLITPHSFIETLALIAVCLLGGTFIASLLKGTAFELPTFVCVLFVGVLISNGLAALGWYRIFEREVSVVGNVSLSLFLALALMSLRLWDLAALALPIFALLLLQTLAMALYAVFVTFRVMGRNYDAAVLAAGHCGFGLGATPTAIANMQAVTERFGPSHLAFLVVPMVGAFFIDIVNAIVIKLYLALPFIASRLSAGLKNTTGIMPCNDSGLLISWTQTARAWRAKRFIEREPPCPMSTSPPTTSMPI